MTAFTPRTDLVELDFNDRRRLAVSQSLIIIEATDRLANGDFGQVVLANVTGPDEVVKMGDKVQARLRQIFGQN